MATLRNQVAHYANTAETVLICGETGTGKELIARLLHDLSSRRSGPFVSVNCAAIPESLAESELFGNNRGAYTGAVHCRRGLFSEANTGTLFLDEFGELPMTVQPKLLRAIELRAFRPLGGIHEHRSDVRIIAATNRNLEASIARQQFRSDLYHRVSVLSIAAPPLRHHRDDIPELIGAFFARFLPPEISIRVTDSAMAQLVSHPWPGNVRELANVIRRSLILSANGLIEEVVHNHTASMSSTNPRIRSAKSQCNLIDLLTRNRGSLTTVAREMGVSVRTVQRRVRDYGLRLADFRAHHDDTSKA